MRILVLIFGGGGLLLLHWLYAAFVVDALRSLVIAKREGINILGQDFEC